MCYYTDCVRVGDIRCVIILTVLGLVRLRASVNQLLRWLYVLRLQQ